MTLPVWGAATRALCEDRTLQQALKEAQGAGVNVIACRRCAELIGGVGELKALGVKVFYDDQTQRGSAPKGAASCYSIRMPVSFEALP
ncbi:MAG: hypothetical protein V2I40_00745 [Desulfobacteraceae bacterium]|nr:hypothetical protein [Desulfobacteraceae bacterium]